MQDSHFALLLYPTNVAQALLHAVLSAAKSSGLNVRHWGEGLTKHVDRAWMDELMKLVKDHNCLRVAVIMNDHAGQVNDNVVWELGFAVGFHAAQELLISKSQWTVGKTIAIVDHDAFRKNYPADLQALSHVVYTGDPAKLDQQLRSLFRLNGRELGVLLREQFGKRLLYRARLPLLDAERLKESLWTLLLTEHELLLIDEEHADASLVLAHYASWCEAFVQELQNARAINDDWAQNVLITTLSTHFVALTQHLTRATLANADEPRVLTYIQAAVRSYTCGVKAIAAIEDSDRPSFMSAFDELMLAVYIKSETPELLECGEDALVCCGSASALLEALLAVRDPLIQQPAALVGKALLSSAANEIALKDNFNSHRAALKRASGRFAWHTSVWQALSRVPHHYSGLVPRVMTLMSERDLTTQSSAEDFVDGLLKVEASCQVDDPTSREWKLVALNLSRAIEKLQDPSPAALRRLAFLISEAKNAVSFAVAFEKALNLSGEPLSGPLALSLLRGRTFAEAAETDVHSFLTALEGWSKACSKNAPLNSRWRQHFGSAMVSTLLNQVKTGTDLSIQTSCIASLEPVTPAVASLFVTGWHTVDEEHDSLTRALNEVTRAVAQDVTRDGAGKQRCSVVVKVMESVSGVAAEISAYSFQGRIGDEVREALYRVECALVRCIAQAPLSSVGTVGQRCTDLVKALEDVLGEYGTFEQVVTDKVDLAAGRARMARTIHYLKKYAQANVDDEDVDSIAKDVDDAADHLRQGTWPAKCDAEIGERFLLAIITGFCAVCTWLGVARIAGEALARAMAAQAIDGAKAESGRLFMLPNQSSSAVWMIAGAALIVTGVAAFARGKRGAVAPSKVRDVLTAAWYCLLAAVGGWLPANYSRFGPPWEPVAGSLIMFVLFYILLLRLPPARKVARERLAPTIYVLLGHVLVFAFAATAVDVYTKGASAYREVGAAVGMRVALALAMGGWYIAWIRFKTRSYRTKLLARPNAGKLPAS